MTETLPYANLYYQNGNSDKVYKISVYRAHGLGKYHVCAQYGRRGKALNNTNKTSDPVSLFEARVILNKLVDDKKAKGYKEEGSVVAPTKVFMLPLKSLPKVGQSIIVVKYDDLVPLDTGRRIKDED